MPSPALRVAALAPITVLGLALILILCLGALAAATVVMATRALGRAAARARDAARHALPAAIDGGAKKPAAASRAG